MVSVSHFIQKHFQQEKKQKTCRFCVSYSWSSLDTISCTISWGTRTGHFTICGWRLHCRFQHLRQDLRHGTGDVLDVINVVAQQRLQPRIRILESTDHRAFAVATIKLELKVLLEIRNTLVHIETRTRLQIVDRALGDHTLRCQAGLHRPVKTVGLVGLSRHVCLWSHCSELPTASLASQARVYCGC